MKFSTSLARSEENITSGCLVWVSSYAGVDVIFDVSQNKLLSKHFSFQWFETPWRWCNIPVIVCVCIYTSFLVWRRHEDMSLCTPSRVNTNYERIALTPSTLGVSNEFRFLTRSVETRSVLMTMVRLYRYSTVGALHWHVLLRRYGAASLM